MKIAAVQRITRQTARSRPIAKTLVYTITTGRSGTNFLADLCRANLPGAQVHHERAGWLDLGVNCPDASHLTRFNSVGNRPEIRAFWKQKLARDAAVVEDIYVEATHLHAKAGLVENLDLVPQGTSVILVAQRRDPFKIVWSLHNRMDFRNYGFTWLWALDPRYPNVITDAKPLGRYGMAGSALWYVIEMQVRAAYYRRLTAEMPHVTIHDTSLEEIITEDGAATLIAAVTGQAPDKLEIPPPANTLKDEVLPETTRDQVRTMVDGARWDADAIAASYWDSGRRLATPPTRGKAA